MILRAIKKAFHNLRRKRIAAAKIAAEPKFMTIRAANNEARRLHHIADVLEQRERGVLLGDGVTVANMENRWVRRELFLAGALYPKQKKFYKREGGIKVLGQKEVSTG